MRTTTMAISKKRRILVADDEVDVTLTLKLCLEENGFIVDTYDNPVCAIKNFKAGVYDLLMVDIKMPDMNGFELYKEKRQRS
jgi:two-component system response regulator ChvI